MRGNSAKMAASLGALLMFCCSQVSSAAGAVAPLAPNERASAMRAAGFQLRGNSWVKSCEADEARPDRNSYYGGEITKVADLDGDGKPEVVIEGGNSYCHGNTGTGFTLLTHNGPQWSVLLEETGIPAFYPRQGIAWPDVEIGGPGTNCFGFMRWNGSEYAFGGKSLEGKICELDPAFAATSGASSAAVASQGSSTGASRIPLKVGYYAYVEGSFSTCANPVTGTWYFDGTRFWEESDITDPKHEFTSETIKWQMVAADRFRISSRGRDEDGRWMPQVSENEYQLTGPQSFTFLGTVGTSMGSNETYQLCSASQLPAKARWYKGAK